MIGGICCYNISQIWLRTVFGIMRLQRGFLTASLCLALTVLPAVSAAQAQTASSSSTQVESVQKMKVFPLPGHLDSLPMLNSNSPEVIEQAGILVSTLPGGTDPNSPFLNYAFTGDFGVFSHHIAKDSYPGQRLLYLGLLVTNQSDQTVHLQMQRGASYLSQPDALFRALPSVENNSDAMIYAGPGDRVTTELLAGKSPLQPVSMDIPPRSTRMVYSLPVPTSVAILPPINGRSSLMYFHSDGPVYLSQVATFARKEGLSFVPPTLEDYRELLNQRHLAGAREMAPTEYNPADPPTTASFRYGRVAGVAEGLHWTGQFFEGARILERPAVDEISAYPISSLYLKRWGTEQNQSGTLLRRYPDTALQAHGNYGVRYELTLPLHNDTANFETFKLGLAQPIKMTGPASNAEMDFVYPPNKPVFFRGSLRLQWTDEFNQQQDEIKHLVLHQGQETVPVSLMTVPPHVHYDLKLSFYYPADCTPPQLLTLERLE